MRCLCDVFFVMALVWLLLIYCLTGPQTRQILFALVSSMAFVDLVIVGRLR